MSELPLLNPAQTWNRAWRLFVPLVFNIALASFTQPLITTALARSDDAATALAGFTLAFTVAGLVGSPALRVQQTCMVLINNATCRDVVRRFFAWVALGLTGLAALVAFTPLADFVFVTWKGASADLLPTAMLAIRVLLLYPAVMVWRAYAYGLSLRRGDTRALVVAVASHLVVLAAALFGFGATGLLTGVVLVGVATVVSRAAEAIAAQLHTARFGRPLEAPADATAAENRITTPDVLRFFAPLIMAVVVPPLIPNLIQSGMTRVLEPKLSLAGLAASGSIAFIFNMAISALQPTVLTMLKTERFSIPTLRKFCFLIGACMSLLAGLVVFSPVVDWLLGDIIGVPADIIPYAKIVLYFAVPEPVIMWVENFYAALLLHARRTMAVFYIALTRLVFLTIALVAVVMLTQPLGAALAGAAMLFNFSVESAAAYVLARIYLTPAEMGRAPRREASGV